MDALTAQMTAVATEIDVVLADLEEAQYLRTIPGWAGPALPGSSLTSGPSRSTDTVASSSSSPARIPRAAIPARRSAAGSG